MKVWERNTIYSMILELEKMYIQSKFGRMLIVYPFYSMPDELPQIASLGKGVSEADAAIFLER